MARPSRWFIVRPGRNTLQGPLVSYRFGLNSLRSRLLLLVLLALLPPLCLTIYGAMRERANAIIVAENDLQRLTGLAAASEAKSIEGVRQFLLALSDVPDLMRDPASCASLLQTMLKKNLGYINLGVIDLSGDLRCSAVSPGAAVNVSDRSYFRKTLTTGKFAVGEHVFGRVVRKHSINASYPIVNADGIMVAMVFASLDLATLDRFITDIDLPADAIMVTADANGVIVARRPQPEKWIGTKAQRDLFDLMVKVRFGTAEITGADRIARLHAFAAVGDADVSAYTLSIGIPMAAITAPANRQQAIELLSLMIAAALALVGTWFVANFTILNRVHALVAATRRIADGHLDSRSEVRYGSEEISELALAFDRMAYALQRGAAAHDDALARLFATKERAQVTLQSIGDAVITTDAAGCVDYLNPVAQNLTGWSTDEARGKPLAEVFNVINSASRQAVPSTVAKAVDEGPVDGIGRDSVLISRNGNEQAIEDSAAPIRDRDAAIIGTVVVFRDVSQSRDLARQLSHQASHDALTGLVNRREFERRLQLTLDNDPSKLRQHALLFLDLDHFKVVNDRCGHNAGDELLRQLTALLQPMLRDSDTLARVGGDEFAALLENCTLDSAARIADKLCKTVCAFRFAWRDQIFPIGVSIGLVNFSNNHLSMTDLLTAADQACYQAKHDGRNRVHVFLANERDNALLHGESEWRSRIEQALEEDRFLLLSQEVRGLGTIGTPVPHHELSLRMLSETGAQILPSAFMPAAERYGLMQGVQRWLMRHAFVHHAQQLAAGGGQRSICAVPLWASGLADPLLPVFLNGLFAEHSVPPDTLCFQIAETTAIADLTRTMHFMDAMKPLGCRFALDDFGSGMSSFAYLTHLRVDFVKIDGAFIMDMAVDPVGRAKVEAINHVSHAMGIRTIARHVDDQDCIDKLRAIRVDYAQGNAIAPPVPITAPAEMPPAPLQMPH